MLRPQAALNFVNSSDTIGISVVAAGYYTGELSGQPEGIVLTPISFLESMEEDELHYMMAEFTLDPDRNRALDEFRKKGKEIVEAPDAALIGISLVVWDGELRQAIEPMEKNITLMKILYPLSNGVAFLVAAGLAVLFLFQRRREAAILRVLGVGKLPTQMLLVLELLTVNLAGLLLGAGLVEFLTRTDGARAMPLAAACYFLGCMIGALGGAAFVTRGRPLELLQGKD